MLPMMTHTHCPACIYVSFLLVPVRQQQLDQLAQWLSFKHDTPSYRHFEKQTNKLTLCDIKCVLMNVSCSVVGLQNVGLIETVWLRWRTFQRTIGGVWFHIIKRILSKVDIQKNEHLNRKATALQQNNDFKGVEMDCGIYFSFRKFLKINEIKGLL